MGMFKLEPLPGPRPSLLDLGRACCPEVKTVTEVLPPHGIQAPRPFPDNSLTYTQQFSPSESSSLVSDIRAEGIGTIHRREPPGRTSWTDHP
jgi:hypothetical protein